VEAHYTERHTMRKPFFTAAAKNIYQSRRKNLFFVRGMGWEQFY
jgi:hypothetical protein